MKAVINPGLIIGNQLAPTSKSSMQRACALALMNAGNTTIKNPGNSNDDNAALSIIENLGAKILEKSNAHILIRGVDNILPATINPGESGLSIRMFAPIAALANGKISINGTGSLLKRPMIFFDELLPQLGAQVISNKGFLPMDIYGPIKPKQITIDGSLSSQFLTGLLFAYAKSCTSVEIINVTNLKSKPYIDLSLEMLSHFGYKVENKNYESFIVHPNNGQNNDIEYTVEGDWSGGAFLLVASAIAGPVSITGLDINSAQADKAILTALKLAGASILNSNNEIKIEGGDLNAFEFDATDCPDLFPPLAALAAFCKGTSIIKGVSRLEHKESNRGLTIKTEFEKLGVNITLNSDIMLIEGGGEIKAAKVFSHHDHRIAMALAVTALRANAPIEIEDAEAVNKSYPEFYNNMKNLSANISIIN